jgi:hypothetical protein
LQEGRDATACPVRAQRPGQRHDGPFAVFRGWGRVALGSRGACLRPGRLVGIRAIPPLVEPTVRAGQWPPDVREGVCGTIGVEGLLTSLCLAWGDQRGLGERRGSGPWQPVCSMSWHHRWRWPGSLRRVMMASLGPHHAARRPCQGTRSESQCRIKGTAPGSRPRRAWAFTDAVGDRMGSVAEPGHPRAVQ